MCDCVCMCVRVCVHALHTHMYFCVKHNCTFIFHTAPLLLYMENKVYFLPLIPNKIQQNIPSLDLYCTCIYRKRGKFHWAKLSRFSQFLEDRESFSMNLLL